MSNEQLARLPAAPIDWQTRAEEAERHTVLSVSNGSWKAAARHCGAQIIAALEGK